MEDHVPCQERSNNMTSGVTMRCSTAYTMHRPVRVKFFFCLVVHSIIILTITSAGVMTWPVFCPTSCTCSVQTSSMSQQERKTINCDGELLTSPPANLSANVETLLFSSNRIILENLRQLVSYVNLSEINLSDNHIYGLGDVQTYLPSLRYLNVDANEIDYFGNKTFSWCPNLQALSARTNKIELMHDDAFAGLLYLQSLDLSDNRLFAVVPAWFTHMRSLTKLNLNQNNIHVLREGAFHSLGSLQTLDVSHNQLEHIYDKAFIGLNSLQWLSLLGNHLKEIPLPALQMMRNLKELNLGSNQFSRLNPNSVRNLRITYLSLGHLDHLTFIDRNAFVNLTKLNTLEISHNKLLNYVDPRSFKNVPQLQKLVMEHNNISVFEKNLIDSLPSLRELRIVGNSLFCDCNMRWLVDEYRFHLMNLTLPQAKSLMCHAPTAYKLTYLDSTAMNKIPNVCAPRIMAIFPEDLREDLGDPIRLDCRAVGQPTPQTDWLLPEAVHSHEPLSLHSNDGSDERKVASHITISAAGTLSVQYAQGTDSGDYTCIASNHEGRDERVAHLQVKTNLASVIVMHVQPTSITISWRSTSYNHEYQILHRRLQSNESYHSTNIEPYMRSFTANALIPGTRYQFCIAMQQGVNTVRINCTTVSTKKKDDKPHGMFNARNYIIGGAIAGFIVLVVVLCTVGYYVKRYNKRKREEEELYSDNLTQLFLASMDSMSDTTPITYENRGAEMYDEDDDIEEMRGSLSMPGCSTERTTVIA